MMMVFFTVPTSLKNEIGPYEHSSFSCVKLVKKETRFHEHNYFPVSSSLKNETNPPLIESILSSDLMNEPSFYPPVSNQ